MFANLATELAYCDPWRTTLASRMRMLTAKPRRIAYFYEQPDTSTFRYRCMNMTECLAADETAPISAGWFDHADLAAGGRFIDAADVLVICRARYNAAVGTMVARARARQIPVLFDCDDLVFDPRRIHLILNSLALDVSNDANWSVWFGMVGRLRATFDLCDGFITTNEFLASQARSLRPGLRTAIVPNYLNHAQQDVSFGLHAKKRASGFARDGWLHIGYFSGTPTHALDFEIAAPAIIRLMRRDPRIKLRIVGFLELKGELMEMQDRVEFMPLQDFINLQRLVAEVEINIAPLQDNVFTNCKSELKFFEAAICGTLTVATPTSTFRNAIVHGETGLLAEVGAWDEALAQAVALVDDVDSYARIAERAAAEVQRTYGWDRQSGLIAAATA